MRKEKVSALGSVVAATAASVCCIGPLVAVLLGTGSLAARALDAGAVARLDHAAGTVAARSECANVETLKVRRPSMDCAACGVNIEQTLAKKNGIESARVTFKTKEAVVEYDAARISPDGIVAAIDETGFKAELVIKQGKQ